MGSRPLAMALVLAALVARPATGQMLVDQPGRAPGFGVRVTSWAEIPFRTIVRQRFDFSCGSAAIATLLTYQYGLPTNETTPFKAMFEQGDQEKIRKLGFSLLDMKRYLQSRGLLAQGYSLDLEDVRALGRPMIALVNVGGYTHFVVIKGARDGHVLLGDPTRGLLSISDNEFKRIWGGLALIVMEPPTHVTASFNLARDWDPWSPSPIRTFQGERTINSITDNLPPIYQLQTQILPYVVPVGGIK